MFGLDPLWVWATITAILLIIEVTTGTFFLYLIAGSSALTALASMLSFMDVERQLLLFGFSSLIITLLGSKWLNRDNKPLPTLNNPGAEFVGRTFTLDSPIVNGRGQISINDSPWQLIGPDLPKGSSITVISANKGVLNVKAQDF